MQKIDKGIPLPTKEKRNLFGTERKYPWLEMEVGDSFEFLLGLNNAKSQVYQAHLRYKKHYPERRFVAAKTLDGQQVRIWRVA